MPIELIHPILVHFPLALLVIGTCVRILAIFFKESFLFSSWIMLGLGVFFGWLAILAGEYAHDIVGPQLCDHMILHEHSDNAYLAIYLFSGLLAIDWMNDFWFRKAFISLLCPICFAISAVLLIYAGFLGGSLVFDQGAGVHKCCNSHSSR